MIPTATQGVSFLEWTLVGASAVLVLVGLWTFLQIRAERRRRWIDAALRAVRERDLDGLLSASTSPWSAGDAEGLARILTEVSLTFSKEASRVSTSELDGRMWERCFAHAPLAAVLLGEDETITAVSDSAAASLGGSRDDLVGRRLAELLPPAEPVGPGELAILATVDVPPGSSAELRHRRTGTATPVLLVRAPIDAAGSQAEVGVLVEPGVVATRDPEDERARGLEALGDLAASVAHDFNDSLTTILGRSALLQEELREGDPAWDEVAAIVESAESARRITRQLLAFSRPHLDVRQEEDPKDVTHRAAPSIEALAGSEPEEPAGAIDSGPGSFTICLVEDEPQVRGLLAMVLEGAGYRVLVMESGPAALSACAAEERIDLLVTDLSMPGMAGTEVFAELSRRFEAMEVIFISGYVDDESVRLDLRNGRTFLQKPFRPTELLAAVEAVLGRNVPEPAARHRILVVDDEEEERIRLRTLVEALDHECFLAADRDEALEILARMHVDAVISDMVMPELDGLMPGRDAGASSQDLRTRLETVGSLGKPSSQDELRLSLQEALEDGGLPPGGPGGDD